MPISSAVGGGLYKETITTVEILPSHWPCDQRLRYLDFAQEMSGSAGVIWPQLLGGRCWHRKSYGMAWKRAGEMLCSVWSYPNHCNFDECTIVYKYFSGRLVFWPLKWRSNSHRILAGNTTKLEFIWWHRVAYLSTPVYLRLFVYLFIIIYPSIDPSIHLSISLSIKYSMIYFSQKTNSNTYSHILIIREYIVQNSIWSPHHWHHRSNDFPMFFGIWDGMARQVPNPSDLHLRALRSVKVQK